jgi:membrane-associated phospholipid phosphatase
MLENGVLKFVDNIGYLGPFLLLFASIYLLWNKSSLLTYYLIGYGLNIIINFLLKIIIKQPRPSEDLNIFNALKGSGKTIPYDKYGMPSGHSQSVFYSTLFIYFALKEKKYALFFLLISLLTCYQRIKYDSHTFLQIICGSIIGGFMGYLFFILASKKIMGVLHFKPDDNAPV